MNRYGVAVVTGSIRKDSLNMRLARALVRLAPGEFDFDFVRIDDLPLYNADEDDSRAEPVLRLKRQIEGADAVLFVSPEYNRSIPGVLKNAIDQGSRPPERNSWAAKPAGIIGVSTGRLGTALCQQHLRNTLAYLDMRVMGQPEAFIQMAEGLFDEDGGAGPASGKFLQDWVDHFAAWVREHARAG